jgi:hypothetical protein
MASLAAAPGADAKGAAVADGERSIGIYQSAGGTSLRGPIPRPTTEADFANEALFHSWYHVPGESWEVRVGPNYKYNGTKAPSAPCLYTCVECDAFTSNGGPGWMASNKSIPTLPLEIAEILGVSTTTSSSGGSGASASGGSAKKKKKKGQSAESAASGGDSGQTKIPVGYVHQEKAGGFSGHAEPGRDYLNPLGKLPHHIVWSCSYPRYNPAMFGSQNDGDNVTVHAIFQITEATARESMLPDDQQSNAVKLARRWAHNCGHGDEASCRSEANRAPWTKAIVRKVNGGLPLGVNQFNGKPAIQYTNTFRKWYDATTLECQHTMHMCLPYPIKKILFYNRELTQNWVVDYGVVVEGEGDEEQPEQMLFSWGVHKVGTQKYHELEF